MDDTGSRDNTDSPIEDNSSLSCDESTTPAIQAESEPRFQQPVEPFQPPLQSAPEPPSPPLQQTTPAEQGYQQAPLAPQNFQQAPPAPQGYQQSPLTQQTPPSQQAQPVPQGYQQAASIPQGFQSAQPTSQGYQQATSIPQSFQQAPPALQGYQQSPLTQQTPPSQQAQPVPQGYQQAASIPQGFQQAPPALQQASTPQGYEQAPPQAQYQSQSQYQVPTQQPGTQPYGTTPPQNNQRAKFDFGSLTGLSGQQVAIGGTSLNFKLIIAALAAIESLLFFFPWFNISCSGVAINFSGLNLAFGKTYEGTKLYDGAFWVVLLLTIPVAMAVLSILHKNSMFPLKSFFISMAGASAVGFFLLIIVASSARNYLKGTGISLNFSLWYSLAWLLYIVLAGVSGLGFWQLNKKQE